jgi:hypothetical protein
MAIPTSLIWTILVFDEAYKYGDGEKFWGYVRTNAELVVTVCHGRNAYEDSAQATAWSSQHCYANMKARLHTSEQLIPHISWKMDMHQHGNDGVPRVQYLWGGKCCAAASIVNVQETVPKSSYLFSNVF